MPYLDFKLRFFIKKLQILKVMVKINMIIKASLNFHSSKDSSDIIILYKG